MFTVNNKSLISKYVQSQTDFSNMTNAVVYDNIMSYLRTSSCGGMSWTYLSQDTFTWDNYVEMKRRRAIARRRAGTP